MASTIVWLRSLGGPGSEGITAAAPPRGRRLRHPGTGGADRCRGGLLEQTLRAAGAHTGRRRQGVGHRGGHRRHQPPGEPAVRAVDGPDGHWRTLLEFLPGRGWSGGLAATWMPGEGARRRLEDFLDGPVEEYGTGRDVPGVEGTSRLFPHLRFGEISPFRIWHALRERFPRHAPPDVGIFRSELGWREFCWPTGAWVRHGSGTRSWTPTPQAIRPTGSGWRAPARTLRPISGFSIR